MKTLLQINSVVSYGSTGRIAEDLGLMAMDRGWKSYIAYGRPSQPSKSELIRIGTDWDIKRNGLQTRLFDRHGLGSVNATRELVVRINEIQPDIIHLHNIHGYYLNIEVLFKHLAAKNTPVVWTFHDCWPMTGHCTHFDFVNCQKWKSLCSECPQKKSYPASFFIDRSEKNFRLKKQLFTAVETMTIVPVSQWLGNIVSQSFFKHYPIHVINNGIDLKVFNPVVDKTISEKYNPEGKFVILGVASKWDDRKGLSDFITLRGMVEHDISIMLVGLSPEQIKHLPPGITGISRTESKEDLAALYSMADVYMNLSVEETFGLTTVEAFACGTPAIVYNATASPELLTPATGIIVEKKDIRGLIIACKQIRETGTASYASACRLRAVELYNKTDRSGDYMDLYESILHDKKKQ